MIALSNVNELNKILRNQLIKQSRLNSEQVLNALSIHGEDLDKLLEEQAYISIDRSDLLILFELQSRRNDSDVSMTNEDDSVTMYRSFNFRVIIYGNDSSSLANVLVSRFRTEAVRNELHYNGVYLERVNEPDILNEYKNNTMWLRNDIVLEISCKFNISQIDVENTFETLSKTEIL